MPIKPLPKKLPTPKDSEFRAYIWIKEALASLGWDTRNPSKYPAGRVYTQQECHQHEELGIHLAGGIPENVVKVREGVYWVIEAKAAHAELGKAIQEARDYAKAINHSKNVKALFVSGVAGTETHLVETEFWHDGQFIPVTLNGYAITGLPSPQMTLEVVDHGPAIHDVQVDLGHFLTRAEKINSILHAGGINLKDRAALMSALLLALVEDTSPNIDAPPDVLIEEINARSRRVLRAQGKDSYHEYVRLNLPATPDNHTKYKNALVRVIQELHGLNIRSAMNSGTDVLGKFYEMFLKYGNGAKDIGIVLTPRHVTAFAASTLNVTAQDVVYDPCCGTGGFLVSAFDHVRSNTPNKTALNEFKQHNIFGVDGDTQVVTLAIVNMIFRGDGKNNITEGDCFAKHIVKRNGFPAYSNGAGSDGSQLVTKVLMNPPFPSQEEHNEDYEFVDAALRQMQDGGLLFSILPYPTLVKTGQWKAWRRNQLLPRHTLLCVITLPPDLFYPTASVHTAGVYIRKGLPHPPTQNVLWIRAVYDGTRKSKSKRLEAPGTRNDFPAVEDLVRGFLINPKIAIPNVGQFHKACPVDYDDPNFELVPEYYLDQAPPTDDEVKYGVERVIRDAAAFLVREGLDDPYHT